MQFAWHCLLYLDGLIAACVRKLSCWEACVSFRWEVRINVQPRATSMKKLPPFLYKWKIWNSHHIRTSYHGLSPPICHPPGAVWRKKTLHQELGVHKYLNLTLYTQQIQPLQDIQNPINLSDLINGFSHIIISITFMSLSLSASVMEFIKMTDSH